MDTTENEKLHQLNTMVLTESISRTARCPAYLFSETADNQDSVLFRGLNLITKKIVSSLFLIDDTENTNSGYPGGARWKKWFTRVSEEMTTKVQTIPLNAPSLHTLSESLALVAFAKRKRWSKLIIVAPPFHQLRCFLSMVTAVNHLNPQGLRVYNQVGFAQPWGEQVVHSQGTTTGTRKDFIIGELRRIEKYQKEGTPVPLVSTDAALEYLEWRDS